ncbi:hypothetical protein A2625_04115 [candidate division WOR-1 bacterium RIFCSPHIGHO2_01_FULL_53_15]|uniref:PorV/PorQ family protein n=1 Tax=candidate division WOR-1 bacterium RIFCSPHIGHO2_01_FULL_53_15 TaxID=1802564 RepID=A0A1F4Q091_UNCSA|nr:MAG: hypothetical protein A2625_04115 [candidate division WOR-1 bacterium RIFCSPHIGHO2_01_FULL_53_15]
MSFVFWSFKFMICLGFSVLYLFWAITSSAIAQGQAGTDIAILNAGVGARALGMGSAFTAIADNADAPYWNPAGLGQVTSNEITTMQTRLSTDADHYYISYVRPALGGTLGISWIQVGLGSINQTSAEVDINNEVQNLSIFSYFSNAYLLSYGKNLNEHISVGLTGKYLTSDMAGVSGGQGSGYSVTPGLLIRLSSIVSRPSSIVTIGLKLDDALNQQQWGTGTIEKVPPKLRLGLAYHSPNPGTFAVDVSQTMKSNYSPDISAGYEWTDKFLSFRVGYAGSGLTAGAGFAINQARVDYAYVNNRELSSSNVHRISLSGVW